MTELAQSFRRLLRSPIFTAASIVTLVLAIAAATTIYSVYNAVILRPARTTDWNGVFQLTQHTINYTQLEPAQFRALRTYPPSSVSAVAARTWRPVVLQLEQRALKTYVEMVDGDLAGMLRIKPLVGRLLDSRDEAPGMKSVVVSAGLWGRWFGGRSTIEGHETIGINGERFRIVGVMPIGLEVLFAPDAWIPATAYPEIAQEKDPSPDDLNWWSYVRARDGATRAELESTISAAVAHVLTTSGARKVTATPRYRRPGFMDVQVFGLAALLLLAACANLTNLVYARITQRKGDIAVRLALGAGRWRVLRSFLLEIAAIASLSTAGGYALAIGATQSLSAAFPTFGRNRWGLIADLTPDIRVAVFAAVAAAVVAVALSMIVAFSLGRVSTVRALAASGGLAATGAGGRRFRSALVSVQVTVAVVLVMAAGLWLIGARKEIDRATTFSDFRYDPSSLATVRLDLQHHGYSDTRGAILQERVLHALRRLPEVQAAAISTGLPGAGRSDLNRPSPMYLIVDEGDRVLSGRPRTAQGSYAAVSPQFLQTIQLPLVSGRSIEPADVDGAPLVALISESVSKMLFPNGDALGRRLLFNTDGKPREVVGIFSDPLVSTQEPWRVPQNILVLVPLTQHYKSDAMIVLRASRPGGVVESVAAAIASIDPDVAIFDAASVEEALLAESAPFRAAAKGVSALGALSLMFATLGIYGVMSFYVSTRVREFGIRMALGATPLAILRHVFKEARLLLLFGLLCGVFIMAVAERVLDHTIFRMMPNAVEMWIAAIALVLATGLIATFFPARRASRTDPLAALREL